MFYPQMCYNSQNCHSISLICPIGISILMGSLYMIMYAHIFKVTFTILKLGINDFIDNIVTQSYNIICVPAFETVHPANIS